MCQEKCLKCVEGKWQGIYNELGYLLEDVRVCTNSKYSLIDGICPHEAI